MHAGMLLLGALASLAGAAAAPPSALCTAAGMAYGDARVLGAAPVFADLVGVATHLT